MKARHQLEVGLETVCAGCDLRFCEVSGLPSFCSMGDERCLVKTGNRTLRTVHL